MVKTQNVLLLISLIVFSTCTNLRGLSATTTRPRSAGILMHITSLPSNYGIGTLGKEAYKFADFLVKAKQKNWQMLPLGLTICPPSRTSIKDGPTPRTLTRPSGRPT